MKSPFAIPWSSVRGKTTLGILVFCILLVSIVIFLMASNYTNQLALQESTRNRFRLDMEKRAASLSYFFSERKYDLGAMAISSEIQAYFMNQSLGMSEEYGLKVSLFVIQRMFEKAVKTKTIQGDRIYERFLLIDTNGRHLLDTAPLIAANVEDTLIHFKTPEKAEPFFSVQKSGGNYHIQVAAICLYRNEVVGCLIAWLDTGTLYSHLIDAAEPILTKGFEIASQDGSIIRRPLQEHCTTEKLLPPEKIADMPVRKFISFPTTYCNENGIVLAMRIPLYNLPLNLVAWSPEKAIMGGLSPAKLLLGSGLLILAIMAGIALLIFFNLKNRILHARVAETNRQQVFLTAKNQQLEEEMNLRQEAEERLEKQRTLRMRSDRLRSLGEMAAGIAHELNQPLVGVRGLAELILFDLDTPEGISQKVLKENVERIIEQADRMVHIVTHVRMFAREAGNTDAKSIDLNDVIRSSMGMMMAQLRSNGILVEEKFSDRPLPVLANPFSLEEVVLNLLSNARDALEKRQGDEEQRIRPTITVTTLLREKNSRLFSVFQISDNGQGIALDIREQLFDPFFTTKTPDKGTGLGLSICKSIVEEYAGMIYYLSEPGKGTTFTIELPYHLEDGQSKGIVT